MPYFEFSSTMSDRPAKNSAPRLLGSPFLRRRRDLSPIPTVWIEWSELEDGHCRAVCQCGSEEVYEEADRRVRLDPYDPSALRHAGECEHRDTSVPAFLWAILKIVL